MSIMAVFHISIEFWGIIICIMASIAIWISRPEFHANKRMKLAMQLCCIILLLNDALAWGFRGYPGIAGYRMVRLSNYMVFFCNYVYMALFTIYLCKSVAELDDKMPKRAYAALLFSLIGIVLLTISQFNNWFYYFDSGNYYHRSHYYIVTQLIAIAGMAVDITILIQYRKRLGKALFFAMLSYFILPAVTTVITIFVYGLALQNLSIVIVTQIMFIADVIHMSRSFDKSQAALIAARSEAQHDPLTGLWNKPSGAAKIQEYIENMKPEDAAALMFVDIDDFKAINDSYGHITGDYWIKEVAAILISVCHKQDIACRFGGDEYLVLLKNVPDIQMTASIISQFKEHLHFKGMEMQQEVHCSVGACQIYGAGQKADVCIELADSALYESKRNGKNTAAFSETGQKN